MVEMIVMFDIETLWLDAFRHQIVFIGMKGTENHIVETGGNRVRYNIQMTQICRDSIQRDDCWI